MPKISHHHHVDVIKMLEYLIDNIFLEFGGRIYQQTIGIPMGTILCTVTCRLVFIRVWGGVCTKSPPSRQETPRTTIQFHLQIYKWCIISEKHKICRVFGIHLSTWTCQPRWLSWMRRPTGVQEVAGSTPAEFGNILSWRLIMKYFLRSFSPFRWFKKGSCQFLAKECAQYWLTA